MKKLLACTLIMALLVVAGCGTTNAPAPTPSAPASEPAPAAAPVVKTGLGKSVSLAKSASATAEKGASAQADVTMCAASFDENGVILSVYFDVAQCKVAFDEKGQLTTDTSAAFRTKKMLKDDYGMKGISGIQKEWYEQAEALEKWMVGKNVNDVLGMKVYERDPNHKEVPDVEELKSSVTITVGDYLKALKDAYENAAEIAL